MKDVSKYAVGVADTEFIFEGWNLDGAVRHLSLAGESGEVEV
jgi:hypothetical protein